ncbi:MAG: FAD-dependent oxidoreductase [Micropepsaceae bacterium]
MAHLKIAVVGSGISGLSAAWLLSQRHEVTLFEADDRLGGHSHTVDCTGDGASIAVDTGFIVYNRPTYPNLTALFDYLNVPTAASDMGFAVSLADGRIEYSGNGALRMLGSWRNLADPAHWRMLRDIVRFFRTAAGEAQGLDDRTTLGQFIADRGYSQDFLDRHLLPSAGAIWSSPPRQMLDYPAKAFLTFFENHGLLKFVDRPQWRTVVGGARQYVRKLVDDSPMRVQTGCAVTSIQRSKDGVTLHVRNAPDQNFDHAVIATHADQALAMLDNPAPEERQCLQAFHYTRNRAVLHRDKSFMPRNPWLWSSWNYLSNAGADTASCTITYWMNALQPLSTKTNYFVTLNPHREPASTLVEREFVYEHPVFTPETARMQRQLWSLQGKRNTWFCGAHFGAGFHEDGLQAGLAVAEQLGGVKRPWQLTNPSTRIHVSPSSPVHVRTLTEAAE